MTKDRFDNENMCVFTEPNLIICEGKGDAAFFRHILDANDISGFQVGFPNDATAGGQFGRTGFEKYLMGVKTRRGYKELKNIIIATDSDLNPSKSFNEVCGQIKEARKEVGGYEVPDEPRTPKGKNPTMSVLLVPHSKEKGNLETLLLNAMTLDKKDKDCFETYFKCLKLDELEITVSSKKKLTTIIAAKNDKNPSCSLAYIWSEEQKIYNPIDIKHSALSDIVEFLQSF